MSSRRQRKRDLQQQTVKPNAQQSQQQQTNVLQNIPQQQTSQAWNQQPSGQHSINPQAFALGPKQASLQTQSTTITTNSTSTGNIAFHQPHYSPSPHINQQLTPQAGQQALQGNTQLSLYTNQRTRSQPEPQQQTFDYTQLANVRSSPPAQPTFDYTTLANIPSATPVSQTSTSATTTATRQATQRGDSNSASNNLGGQARQAAAAKGEAELRRFDQELQQLLVNASFSSCPQRWAYYRGPEGYLCGGGHHFISHEDVDRFITTGLSPFIEFVNGVVDGSRSCPPPADGWHEYMHWSPVALLRIGRVPMPLKHDGSPWDLRPHWGEIHDLCDEFEDGYWY